jgi:RND family efflux transporter MFP subunit
VSTEFQPSGAAARAVATTVALALAALACGDEPAPQAPVARPVKIFEVRAGDAGPVLEFPGRISPAKQADMGFEVPGKIIEFPAQESQRVSEGTVLARLDPRDYQSTLDKERAYLNKAKTDLERFEFLYKQGVNPLSDLERHQRNFEVAEANYEKAEKALEDTYLKAPFDGVVARKLVQDFVNVEAKETVLILQDDSTLEIKVSIPERDFAQMTPGLTIAQRNARAMPTVTLSSMPDREFPAQIKEFATTADPVTRTFEATFSFDNPADVSVLPEMTAKVSIRRRETSLSTTEIQIPANAVVTIEGGEASVWVIDPDTMKVQSAPVVLGDLSGSQVIVKSGLEGGELIATSGVHHLRDGMPVRRFEK